jgi:hypothetical protein
MNIDVDVIALGGGPAGGRGLGVGRGGLHGVQAPRWGGHPLRHRCRPSAGVETK